jgi:hypothetical protein
VGEMGRDPGEAEVGDWLVAAKEVLEYDDERRWMSGSCWEGLGQHDMQMPRIWWKDC